MIAPESARKDPSYQYLDVVFRNQVPRLEGDEYFSAEDEEWCPVSTRRDYLPENWTYRRKTHVAEEEHFIC